MIHIAKCRKCNGDGYTIIYGRTILGIEKPKVRCNYCYGNGFFWSP